AAPRARRRRRPRLARNGSRDRARAARAARWSATRAHPGTRARCRAIARPPPRRAARSADARRRALRAPRCRARPLRPCHTGALPSWPSTEVLEDPVAHLAAADRLPPVAGGDEIRGATTLREHPLDRTPHRSGRLGRIERVLEQHRRREDRRERVG